MEVVVNNDIITAVDDAYTRIAPHVYRTPLEKSEPLSRMTGCELYLKCEHEQKTGSFKYRGAINKILGLTPSQRQRGVVVASSGNHGVACATAGRSAGVGVTVYVQRSTDLVKVEAMRSFGARVVRQDLPYVEVERNARRAAETEEKVFMSCYNDPDLIMGQGSIGLELYEQLKDVEVVFGSLGGGSLVSGVAAYLKCVNPEICFVACSTVNSPVMYESIRAGRVVNTEVKPTIAESLAGGMEPGALTLDYCRDYVDRHVLLTDAEIIHAMWLLAEHERWIVEGAAGAALAGVMKLKADYRDRKVAVILCGRNISWERFAGAVRHYASDS